MLRWTTRSWGCSISASATTSRRARARPSRSSTTRRTWSRTPSASGMTGSGKTGLGIGLIEEAAIDGIPVLAIDPKGDLANLLLTFPALAPSDFRPWVDPSDAAARGLTPDQLAEQQAATWAKGLAEWDQIARIASRPSSAPRPCACSRPAAGPARRWRCCGRCGPPATRTTRTRGRGSPAPRRACWRWRATRELGPHDRELTFVSAILTSAAAATGSADLPWLVQQIQRPSFDRVGVLDLETFYPAKDRQELALRFNSVLASPGFDVWLDGAPLDVGAMLYDAAGKPGDRRRVDRAPGRCRAHAGRVAGAERAAGVDAAADRHRIAARAALHGRGVRLPAAGRQPAVEAAAADAAEAGARLRRRHRAGDAEPGGPRLQGAVEHRHLVPRASCRPSATRAACSTAWRA